ncbi:helix-turn-helix domain-containing protein [Albimonas sp. CAU 1670]|uniref:helix-turn-helix domain-containing protein n=1 Tax=Albimonas sp. CAU 1670 TaxID=3032599 RepID=UPI0023DB3231|nr:helix-turn-helix domain-containing protein [Albimonas sp. CAU 1670]MDF2234510.1 helix-turn-helix domain-containing protein [Albimonas sp. CAU 1670]
MRTRFSFGESEAAATEAALPLVGTDGHVRSLDEIESETICFAISRYGGNLSEAARRLGIGRSTLYRRLGGE